MVLGEVEESVITREVDEETEEEIIKVGILVIVRCCSFIVCRHPKGTLKWYLFVVT